MQYSLQLSQLQEKIAVQKSNMLSRSFKLFIVIFSSFRLVPLFFSPHVLS